MGTPWHGDSVWFRVKYSIEFSCQVGKSIWKLHGVSKESHWVSTEFLADVNSRSRSLYAIADPSVVCLSVCDVGAPYSTGWNFGQFFSPYDSLGTLVFWCQNSLVGTPLSPYNLRSKWPTPFQIAKFRPISAHSASTVIASEKSSIITYRKSTTRFPTSHR